jgi:hypothetical protein
LTRMPYTNAPKFSGLRGKLIRKKSNSFVSRNSELCINLSKTNDAPKKGRKLVKSMSLIMPAFRAFGQLPGNEMSKKKSIPMVTPPREEKFLEQSNEESSCFD